MKKTVNKFHCIARKARENPDEQFTSLAHHLTEDYLLNSFRKLRKSAASGIDKEDGWSYEVNKLVRIRELHERLRAQKYRAPHIKRVWIDKEDGKRRALGISTTEDKIVQRAVTDILTPIYEADFYDFSYGFRPKRSAHQALTYLRTQCMRHEIKWILDADIQGCFDNFDHKIMMELLQRRIKDKSILRLIGKWLKVGVVDGKSFHRTSKGTPQGNIISPLLCNMYLHYVLDSWVDKTIRPLMKGDIFMVRYADDFVIGFEHEEDARRVAQTLPKRMLKYGLTIHPDKTKLMHFMPAIKGKRCTLDFLGFTHYWGKTKRGRYTIKRRTSTKKMRKIKRNLGEACQKMRHEKIRNQYRKLRRKLMGIYQYFGVRGNYIRIACINHIAFHLWRKWLNRRSQKKSYTMSAFKDLLKVFPLPAPRIVHKNV
jgi:group II intron reverse transcriptase/maturase